MEWLQIQLLVPTVYITNVRAVLVAYKVFTLKQSVNLPSLMAQLGILARAP